MSVLYFWVIYFTYIHTAMEKKTDLRYAVLIDADNVPSSAIKEVMEEVAKYGTPTYKRIYGDWTKPHVRNWKEILLANALTPIQQYSYTTGKNATDSAMIIDAMDILYSQKVDGFCIVSSDSDFTRLALRLREAGMNVIGVGEKKTPQPFIVACNKFIYVEVLKQRSEDEEEKEETESEKQTVKKIDKTLIKIISDAVTDMADDDGWAFLGEVGNLMMKNHPDFDPRNYGFKKLNELIKTITVFDIDERRKDNSNSKLVYLRIKPKKKAAPKRAKKVVKK